MTPTIYNASLATGLALVAIGVGMVSVAAAFVVVGSLVLLLTLATAYLARRG